MYATFSNPPLPRASRHTSSSAKCRIGRGQIENVRDRGGRRILDAGHLCQTFCLVATWLRLAPFCTLALKDSVIEKDLDLEGISESVIYVAGVGLPRRGVRTPFVVPSRLFASL